MLEMDIKTKEEEVWTEDLFLLFKCFNYFFSYEFV